MIVDDGPLEIHYLFDGVDFRNSYKTILVFESSVTIVKYYKNQVFRGESIESFTLPPDFRIVKNLTEQFFTIFQLNNK